MIDIIIKLDKSNMISDCYRINSENILEEYQEIISELKNTDIENLINNDFFGVTPSLIRSSDIFLLLISNVHIILLFPF